MPKDDFNNNRIRCSFCGKTQDQVRRIVAGPNAYICNECVLLCQEIVSDDVDSVAKRGDMEIKRPQEIKEILDQYVVPRRPCAWRYTTTTSASSTCRPPPRRTWNCRNPTS